MLDIKVGDRVQMRKKHPCGSDEWHVVRVGADIGLRCNGCQRKVLLTRSQFNKRLRHIISSHGRQEEPGS